LETSALVLFFVVSLPHVSGVWMAWDEGALGLFAKADLGLTSMAQWRGGTSRKEEFSIQA
jgi:hypothetical protein